MESSSQPQTGTMTGTRQSTIKVMYNLFQHITFKMDNKDIPKHGVNSGPFFY